MASSAVTKAEARYLVCLSEGRRALAEARSIHEVKQIRDAAKAAADLLKQQKAHHEHAEQAAMDALVLKLWAERRLGELLAETVDHKGVAGKAGPGRGKKTSSGVLLVLPDGVSRTQSSRWQRVASLEELVFQAYIDRACEKEQEPTTAGALRLAKEGVREGKRKKNRKLVQATTPLPEAVQETYQTIVIDPPWDWGDEGDVDQFGRATPTYQTMSIEQLLALPVGERADKNAHLYLWITNRSLPKGFALLERWGFRYVTCLTWCKPSIGMGNYYRGSTEQVLFGVKGSLELLRKDVGTWFQANRPGRHSGKPDEFYGMVEECSPGPWLELFSRSNRSGWSHWGAEA